MSYRDWLFFIGAGLAVLFMIWVFFKFTEQSVAPRKAAKRAEAESRYLRVVPSSSERTRSSAQD